MASAAMAIASPLHQLQKRRLDAAPPDVATTPSSPAVIAWEQAAGTPQLPLQPSPPPMEIPTLQPPVVGVAIATAPATPPPASAIATTAVPTTPVPALTSATTSTTSASATLAAPTHKPVPTPEPAGSMPGAATAPLPGPGPTVAPSSGSSSEAAEATTTAAGGSPQEPLTSLPAVGSIASSSLPGTKENPATTAWRPETTIGPRRSEREEVSDLLEMLPGPTLPLLALVLAILGTVMAFAFCKHRSGRRGSSPKTSRGRARSRGSRPGSTSEKGEVSESEPLMETGFQAEEAGGALLPEHPQREQAVLAAPAAKSIEPLLAEDLQASQHPQREQQHEPSGTSLAQETQLELQRKNAHVRRCR